MVHLSRGLPVDGASYRGNGYKAPNETARPCCGWQDKAAITTLEYLTSTCQFDIQGSASVMSVTDSRSLSTSLYLSNFTKTPFVQYLVFKFFLRKFLTRQSGFLHSFKITVIDYGKANFLLRGWEKLKLHFSVLDDRIY